MQTMVLGGAIILKSMHLASSVLLMEALQAQQIANWVEKIF